MAATITGDLVRLPSDASEKAVQEYLETWLADHGLEPDVWEPDVRKISASRGFVPVDYDYSGRSNVVAVLRGAGGGRSLAINGHMDVVPANAEGWLHGGPWSGALDNGAVYGRGSVDMKGGIACALVLVDALMACGISLQGDLQLHFVVDEENGGNGTLAALDRGYLADAMIFLEGTSPDILVAANRGAQFFRITVPGRDISVLRMLSNPNAIEKAMKIFAAVRAFSEKRNGKASHPLYAPYRDMGLAQVPTAICRIQAGNWPSTLPRDCRMEGTVECLPGENIDRVKEELKSCVMAAAASDPWMRENPPVIEWFGLAFEPSANALPNALVSGLVRQCRSVIGHDPVVTGAGGCDMRLPLLNHGIPSVLYGPRGECEHGTNEHVEVDSILQVAEIVGRFIVDWCGVSR